LHVTERHTALITCKTVTSSLRLIRQTFAVQQTKLSIVLEGKVTYVQDVVLFLVKQHRRFNPHFKCVSVLSVIRTTRKYGP